MKNGKSKNGGFTLKTHQMFSNHTTPSKLKNATAAILDLSLRKIWAGKSHYQGYIDAEKFRFQCFTSTKKGKASVFKFHQFNERFRKNPFS